jgi:hypothetical protein
MQLGQVLFRPRACDPDSACTPFDFSGISIFYISETVSNGIAAWGSSSLWPRRSLFSTNGRLNNFFHPIEQEEAPGCKSNSP